MTIDCLHATPCGQMVARSALVTGSDGFVGRHFVAELKRRGFQVRAVDKAAANLADRIDCRDFFHENPGSQFNLVVHAAANVGGRQMIDHSPLWVADNLSIDSEMFQWALKAKPDAIVYFSSSAIYPVDLQQRFGWRRLDERDVYHDDFGVPDSMYGWSKLTGERLAASARKTGQRVTIVRPFSGYGEDQSTEYPFGAFLDRVVRRETPFTIWGDGTQLRHWIHIDDIVAATLQMVEDNNSGPVNLATGDPVTFLELARLFMAEAGWSATTRLLDNAPQGVHSRYAATARLNAFYRPKISLVEGIRRALASRGWVTNDRDAPVPAR